MFNFQQFDKHFKRVITQSGDAFNYAILRAEEIINEETRTSKTELRLIDSGVGNWDTPMEKLDYRIDGRIASTDVLFYVTGEKNLLQGDILYRFDQQRFYTVLGTRDFDSHFEVDAAFYEQGFNTKIDGFPELPFETRFLVSDLAQVV